MTLTVILSTQHFYINFWYLIYLFFLSFPGGKSDDTDRDLVHTALRESHEEIGLPDDNIDIWGNMCYIPSRVMYY